MLTNTSTKRASWFWKYIFAVGSVTIAVTLRFLFPQIFRGIPFFLFWPAVILTAWYGGFGPGLSASLLSTFAYIYLIRPTLNPPPDDTLITIYLILFILLTVAISWFYQVRKRMETLAQEQQAWLQVTLNSIGDGVIATDVDGNITFINPVACTLTGWKETEALGSNIQDVFNIINEFTRQPVPIPVMEALRHDTIVGLANHTLLIDKQGNEKPILDSGAPIRASNGDMIGAVLVFRDATPQREAARVQATLELVMSGVDEGFVIFDNQWHFTYANRRAGELGMDARGRSREEMLKMTMEEAFPEAVGTNVYNQAKQAAVDKVSRQFEEYLAPYGRWYEYRIYPTSSGLGIFTVDITERKLMQQKFSLLQQITSSLTAALTPQDVANIMVDRGFALLGANIGSVNVLRDDNTIELIQRGGLEAGMLAQYVPDPSLDVHRPLADAIRSRQPVFIETLEDYQRQYPEIFSSGHPLPGTESLVALPLMVNQEVIGGVVMGFPKPLKLSDNEREFMQTLAQQTAQALKRALLSERTQEMAAVQERQRLAQDLHDSVSQALFSATTIAQAVPLTWERDPEKAKQQLNQVVQINRAAMSEMRILLLELRPHALVKTPLRDLLQHLLDAAKGRKMIAGTLTIEGDEINTPTEVHLALYRIAQESINNVLKHSRANHFDILVQYQDHQVTLHVRDNGQGFDPTAPSTGGMGLTNLRERADEISADLEIRSAPGQGTDIGLVWNTASQDGANLS
jgi:PAS domain S-box-containing protein